MHGEKTSAPSSAHTFTDGRSAAGSVDGATTSDRRGHCERGAIDELAPRRSFLRSCGCALAGLAALSLSPMLGGCDFTVVEPERIERDSDGEPASISVDVSSLAADGMMLVTSERGPDGKSIIIVRRRADLYRALSAECPHARYPVIPAGDRLLCSGGHGHGSTFDLDGAGIAGPALSVGPLKVYPSTYDATRGVLTVQLR